MKKGLILSLVLMFTFQSTLCQVLEEAAKNDSQQELFELYTLKKKRNERTGFYLLGAGVVMFAGGIIAGEKDSDNIGESIGNELGKQILMIGGGGLAVASIPFFAIANKHKNQATLALKGESVSFNNLSTYKSNYLVLSLTIPIDK